MFRFYKVLKIKILEKVKVGLDKFFLIERNHLTNLQREFLVCKNYDKKSNTYLEGEIFVDSVDAYDYFNSCVKEKRILEVVKEVENDSTN